MVRERFRLQPDSRLTFLQGFLKRPAVVGSIIPSSRFLERRIVQIAAASTAGLVCELGPGTGGTTRALLRAMRPDASLLSIEIDPKFVSVLSRNRDPRLIVHEGSATHLEHALREHGLGQPDVILSGIPFSTMPPELGRRILRSVWRALPPGGCFVAYQVRDRVATLGREIFGRPEVDIELRNLPPMRIYRWEKPARLS